jgi:hypothetical protein
MHQASSNAIITAKKQIEKTRSRLEHLVSLLRPYLHAPMFARVSVFAVAAAGLALQLVYQRGKSLIASAALSILCCWM